MLVLTAKLLANEALGYTCAAGARKTSRFSGFLAPSLRALVYLRLGLDTKGTAFVLSLNLCHPRDISVVWRQWSGRQMAPGTDHGALNGTKRVSLLLHGIDRIRRRGRGIGSSDESVLCYGDVSNRMPAGAGLSAPGIGKALLQRVRQASVSVEALLISGKTITRRKSRRTDARSESLATRAYEEIRDQILQGSLPLGANLSRRRLAEELNMSFLPITEALQRLESERLVESRPRIGTRVRIPSQQDILDSYVIREALETQAARMACESMTADERAQLTRSAKHLDDLYQASAIEKEDSQFLFSVHTYHVQFHKQIANLARSAGLVRAIDKEHVLIFNWLYDTTARRTSLPDSFHSSLAEAICSGRPTKADQAMRAHVRYGLDSVVESVRTLNVSGGWRFRRSH